MEDGLEGFGRKRLGLIGRKKEKKKRGKDILVTGRGGP
jgi:hypothetical protein